VVSTDPLCFVVADNAALWPAYAERALAMGSALELLVRSPQEPLAALAGRVRVRLEDLAARGSRVERIVLALGAAPEAPDDLPVLRELVECGARHRSRLVVAVPLPESDAPELVALDAFVARLAARHALPFRVAAAPVGSAPLSIRGL
jgi:hypothetical protein